MSASVAEYSKKNAVVESPKSVSPFAGTVLELKTGAVSKMKSSAKDKRFLLSSVTISESGTRDVSVLKGVPVFNVSLFAEIHLKESSDLALDGKTFACNVNGSVGEAWRGELQLESVWEMQIKISGVVLETSGESGVSRQAIKKTQIPRTQIVLRGNFIAVK